jgi:hypothetical protein
VWLGRTDGTDWLYAAIEAEFGKDAGWYDLRSLRGWTYVGGGAGPVVLVLGGVSLLDFLRKFYGGFAQRLGEGSADALLDWARQRSRKRREENGLEWTGGPPNFFDREVNDLAEGMTGELAGRAADSRMPSPTARCDAG